MLCGVSTRFSISRDVFGQPSVCVDGFVVWNVLFQVWKMWFVVVWLALYHFFLGGGEVASSAVRFKRLTTRRMSWLSCLSGLPKLCSLLHAFSGCSAEAHGISLVFVWMKAATKSEVWRDNWRDHQTGTTGNCFSDILPLALIFCPFCEQLGTLIKNNAAERAHMFRFQKSSIPICWYVNLQNSFVRFSGDSWTPGQETRFTY